MRNRTKKKKWFMIFRTELWFVRNHCVLGSIVDINFDGTRYLVLYGSEKFYSSAVWLDIL